MCTWPCEDGPADVRQAENCNQVGGRSDFAGDDEVKEREEMGGDGGVEAPEDGGGFLTKTLHGGVGILNAAVCAGKGYKTVDLFLAQRFAGAEQGFHGLALRACGGVERMEQREGYFALAQVVAGRFSDGLGGGRCLQGPDRETA